MSSKINGYILAGGKSSRMGEDKGLLAYDQTTFVEQIASQIAPLVSQLTIVANNTDYSVLDFPIIPDQIPDLGPIGGLYTALKHSDTEKNIIVSCDTPFINTKLLAFLIEKSQNHEATILSTHSKIHPLIGIYKQSCLFQIKQFIELKQYKIQHLIQHLDSCVVEIDQEKWFLEKMGYNINTPEEYQYIKTLWK